MKLLLKMFNSSAATNDSGKFKFNGNKIYKVENLNFDFGSNEIGQNFKFTIKTFYTHFLLFFLSQRFITYDSVKKFLSCLSKFLYFFLYFIYNMDHNSTQSHLAGISNVS